MGQAGARSRSHHAGIRAFSETDADAETSEPASLCERGGFSRIGRRGNDQWNGFARRWRNYRTLLGMGSVGHGEVEELPKLEANMNQLTEKLIIDDDDAGLFKVNRKAFTEPEYLELERR